ncbi:MAG TPA: VOC family protein [Terracidiphilus sp.]|nr:VOC family protein [Terracidiphilus sp.]
MSLAPTTSRISPFLWFDTNAEEAVNFYLSIFPNSRILNRVVRSFSDPSGPAGTVLLIAFELDGLPFTALNGGPGYPFTQAVSFFIRCANQQEIDHYWARLTDGGNEIRCGWLKDRFGLCWQVVPENIGQLVSHPAAMQALMQMVKIDIATLERAAQG